MGKMMTYLVFSVTDALLSKNKSFHSLRGTCSLLFSWDKSLQPLFGYSILGGGGVGAHCPSLERWLLPYCLQEFLGAEYLTSPSCSQLLVLVQVFFFFFSPFPTPCAGLIKTSL